MKKLIFFTVITISFRLSVFSYTQDDFNNSINYYKKIVSMGAEINERKAVLIRIIEKYESEGFNLSFVKEELTRIKENYKKPIVPTEPIPIQKIDYNQKFRKGTILEVNNSSVVIDYNEADGIKKGDVFAVYEPDKEVFDSQTGNVVEVKGLYIGKTVIKEVKEVESIAKIILDNDKKKVQVGYKILSFSDK